MEILTICRQMPDIDSLMQEWPADVEQQLRETGLPVADLDCDLPQYVDIICSKYIMKEVKQNMFTYIVTERIGTCFFV